MEPEPETRYCLCFPSAAYKGTWCPCLERQRYLTDATIETVLETYLHEKHRLADFRERESGGNKL